MAGCIEDELKQKNLLLNKFVLDLVDFGICTLTLFPFSGAGDSVDKLEKHLSLLKEEYTKLQRNYAELERKYSKAAAASGDKDLGEFSSFVSRLAMTVASLYGRKTYSDLTVRLRDKSIPAHKFVLNARSEEWREEVLADISELGKFTYANVHTNVLNVSIK